MKIVGAIALVVGALGFIVTLSMDTSVAAGEFGQRVNNIGLINDKQNLLLLFSVISIIGAVFFGLSVKSEGKSSPMIWDEVDASSHVRSCPFCAEKIKFEAVICRYCHRDLRSQSDDAPKHREAGKKLLPDTSSEANCVSMLSELGCQANKSEGGKWTIILNEGRTELYAYSLDELRTHTEKIVYRSGS